MKRRRLSTSVNTFRTLSLYAWANVRDLVISDFIMSSLILIAAFNSVQSQIFNGERVQWVLHIGGPNDDLSSWRIGVDHNGDAIIAGMFKGATTIGSETLVSQTPGMTDVFVAKVNSNGVPVWVTQIAGDDAELIDAQRIVFDNGNNIHLAFFSTSSVVSIGDKKLRLTGYLDAPRLLKLDAQGKYLWCNAESHPGNIRGVFSNYIQLHSDAQGCLITGIVGGGKDASQRQLRKYNPTGDELFRYQYGHSGKHWDGSIPRVTAIATDREGNIYTSVLYNTDVVVKRPQGDTTFEGEYDVVLIKQNGIGEVQWTKTIRGRNGSKTSENVVYMDIVGDTIFAWGSYGRPPAGANSIKEDTVFFGDVPLQPSDFIGFVAKFKLDGSTISVRKLPFNLYPEWEVRAEENAGTILLETAGNGLWVIDSIKATQYYKRASYSISNVCGNHYMTGEFVDTLIFPDDGLSVGNSNRLISRGGKDIYLAFLRPGTKYVPVRPGSRFPLDNSVDLDIPVRTEWWPVSCANGYHFQLSRDSGMNSVVLDTVMSLDPFLNLDRLEPLTKYYWRLRANTSDTFSVWSDTRSFTTVKAQPADVVLEYPANYMKGVTRGVTLRWQASKRATSYLLDVAVDSVFTNKVVNGQLVTGTTVDVTLPGKKTCYWRVRAANSSGSSPWSAVWKFDTRPNKPERAILDQPADASQDEPRNVLLGWKSQGEDIQYKLQIARDDAFAFIEAEKTVTDAFWRAMLEGNTKYYWRVNASNGFEDAEWSPVWSFTTSSTTDVHETEATHELTATYIDGAILVHINNGKLLNQDVKIALYELSGREVMSARTRMDGSPLRVAVPKLTAGTYLLEIREPSGEGHRIKLALD